jgi:Domain of unknown function (DUF1707)/Cell wall-active antibiotics response 4TMS YvqF
MNLPQRPDDSPATRASDDDRERAAAVVRAALVDGRVPANELDERLGRVFTATSRAELAVIVADLEPAPPGRATAGDTAVISDFTRTGRWLVGDSYRASAVIGVGVIDLREASFTGQEANIHVSAWISTVYVVVPDDVEVHVAGTGVIGGFKQDFPSTDRAAGRRVTVTGVAVCSTVYVVRQLPPARERRLRQRELKA